MALDPRLDPLLPWYLAGHRPLPWRDDPTPYRIWVSEIMLQQTTVAAVMPYFERWMTTFPNVGSLASASEDDVLALWQGLGYYRRARNLHAASRIVAAKGLPQTHKGWMELPGIGRSTAAAIASISQGLPEPVVDGNVERVYARLNADDSAKPALAVHALEWAARELRIASPGDWNQALMELGATTCTPVAPTCDRCPVRGGCLASKEGDPARFPTRTAKPPPKPVEISAAVIICEVTGRIGLVKFSAGSWWSGLLGFPSREEAVSLAEASSARLTLQQPIGSVRQAVTSHKVTMTASLGTADAEFEGLTWMSREEIEGAAVPSLHRKLWRLAQKHLASTD